jgi:hypothetical protein
MNVSQFKGHWHKSTKVKYVQEKVKAFTKKRYLLLIKDPTYNDQLNNLHFD